MKLQAILAFSLTLALPAALQAQVDDMEINYRIDPTGIALKIDGGYSNGSFAILISEDGDGTTELGELDSRSLSLGSPTVLIADKLNGRGEYYVHFQFDPQALADAGLKVYLQAVALNDAVFGDVDEDVDPGDAAGTLRISSRLDLDFAAEEWVPDGPEDNDDDGPEDNDDDEPETGDRRGGEEEADRVKR